MITNLRALAATIVIALATCIPSFASETIELTDGNSLLRLCEAALNPNMSRSDLLARTYLMGYVRGFTDAHPTAAEYDIPPGITVEQPSGLSKNG